MNLITALVVRLITTRLAATAGVCHTHTHTLFHACAAIIFTTLPLFKTKTKQKLSKIKPEAGQTAKEERRVPISFQHGANPVESG